MFTSPEALQTVRAGAMSLMKHGLRRHSSNLSLEKVVCCDRQGETVIKDSCQVHGPGGGEHCWMRICNYTTKFPHKER